MNMSMIVRVFALINPKGLRKQITRSLLHTFLCHQCMRDWTVDVIKQTFCPRLPEKPGYPGSPQMVKAGKTYLVIIFHNVFGNQGIWKSVQDLDPTDLAVPFNLYSFSLRTKKSLQLNQQEVYSVMHESLKWPAHILIQLYMKRHGTSALALHREEMVTQ